MTARRLGAEFLGTSFLLLAVVGSGIATSTDGAASAQLFQHAAVVGAVLTALILTFGPVSGAHFNPAVTLVDAAFGGLPRRLAGGYVLAQVAGAATGVLVTNVLFGEPTIAIATTARSGAPLAASEAVATFGLLVVIFGVVRSGAGTAAIAGAVGTWIAAAIFATSSASFANPAVAIARTLSDTWTGIDPVDVPAFVAAQLAGAVAAWAAIRWLFDPDDTTAADVVVPHVTSDTPANETGARR